jgi:hypothetical protein
MKFKNERGDIFEESDSLFCGPNNCQICPVGRAKAKSEMFCDDWILENPEKAAALMGYSIVAIEPADKEPLGPTGFVRDAHAGKGRMDLLPWIGIMEVSKLCEEGALHYGERNIDKGAPLHSLLDSGARHLAKVMSGYTDEDHLRSACWNLLWALQERTTHPELNDTPWPWYGKEDTGK